VVATDGKGKWALLLFSHVTLAERPPILASGAAFPDFSVPKRRLNLDGGYVAAPVGCDRPQPF